MKILLLMPAGILAGWIVSYKLDDDDTLLAIIITSSILLILIIIYIVLYLRDRRRPIP